MYPILLNVFIGRRSFLVQPLAYFMYRIILSTNKDTRDSSFPVSIPWIFSCLIVLAKTSSSIMNSVLVLILVKILEVFYFLFFHLACCWLWAWYILRLLCWDMSPMSLVAPETLSSRNVGFCTIFSSASNEIIIYFVALSLFIQLIMFVWITYVESYLNLWLKFSWS